MWIWIRDGKRSEIDLRCRGLPRRRGRWAGCQAGTNSLYEYLENRYADVVVLTFSQIEDLLGFALPDLARSQNDWWTRAGEQTEKSPCSDAWVLAGRTAAPNLTARTVAFERFG